MTSTINAALQTLAEASRSRFTGWTGSGDGPGRWTIDQLFRALALAILVFALAFGAVALTKVYGRTASVWLANAVIVGMVIRAPRSQWFALVSIAFFANLGANLANDDPLLRAALLSAINMIESMIVILLMGRRFEQS